MTPAPQTGRVPLAKLPVGLGTWRKGRRCAACRVEKPLSAFKSCARKCLDCWAEGRHVVERQVTCVVCETVFISHSYTAKTCSGECGYAQWAKLRAARGR